MQLFCPQSISLIFLIAAGALVGVIILVGLTHLSLKPKINLSVRDPTWLIRGLLVVAFLVTSAFVLYILAGAAPC